MKQFDSVSLVMATHLEASPFLKNMFRDKIQDKPFPVYECEHGHLVISGIGKAAAAMAALHLIENFCPDYILNFGAAGALRKGFHVGEIFQVEEVWEHDRPHLISKKKRTYKPEIIEGFPGLVCATGDVPVLAESDRAALGTGAALVDMEGAGLLQATSLYGIPASLFKVITDTPDHETDGEIIDNIRATRDLLFRFYEKSLLPLF